MYAGFRSRLAAIRGAKWSAVLASLMVAVAVGACGDDNDSSSSGNERRAAVERPTGAPIKIMTDATVGNAVSDNPGVFSSAKAAAEAINAEGGVKGRPIEIITCNNRLTANGAAACARQAARERVVAYTGQDSFTDAYRPILEGADIASTLVATSPPDVQIPLQYPVNGGFVLEINGAPLAAQKAGARTVAFASLEFPGAEENLNNGKRAAEALGLRVVKVIGVPLTQTTFGTTVQQLRDAEPDAVIMYITAPQAANLVQTARQQGFTPSWVAALAAFNYEQFQTFSRAGDNLWMVSALPPATASEEFDGIAAYNEQMDAAAEAGLGDTGEDKRDSNSLNTWVQIHAIAQLAETIDGEITNTSILEALRSSEGIDVQGLVDWSPGGTGYVGFPKITDGGALYYGQIENGEYTPEAEPTRVFEEIGLEQEGGA
jgi:ABC-type branched-subunit amino acid transport system substrate-binding protein